MRIFAFGVVFSLLAFALVAVAPASAAIPERVCAIQDSSGNGMGCVYVGPGSCLVGASYDESNPYGEVDAVCKTGGPGDSGFCATSSWVTQPGTLLCAGILPSSGCLAWFAIGEGEPKTHFVCL